MCYLYVIIKNAAMKVDTKRRSVTIPDIDMEVLNNAKEKLGTNVQLAERIGIKREVLNRLFLAGSASPETVIKVIRFVTRWKRLGI